MSSEPPPAAGGARFLGEHDRTLLSRIEDAGLNASAPPQQRWMDGWIVRTSPGKAQRARCVNAVAPGRRPVGEKLAECADRFRALGLPMLVRITPFTQPPDLDESLAAAGYGLHDDTRVMVLPEIDAEALAQGAPPGQTRWRELAPADFAESVGALRGSSPEARQAHAQRLLSAPTAYRGFALARDGAILACGQIAPEGSLVGLYDIATDPNCQGQGLATWLCKRLLTLAKSTHQSTDAYLQVGADNPSARRIYAALGFVDAYSYHYRIEPAHG